MSLHVPATRAPRVSILVFTVTMALAQLGCMATVSYSHPVAPARLVAVSPGVWVVYDYPEAIFYSNTPTGGGTAGPGTRRATPMTAGWWSTWCRSLRPSARCSAPRGMCTTAWKHSRGPCPAPTCGAPTWCSRRRSARTTTAEGAARQRPRHGGTMGAVEHRRHEPSRTTTAVARAVPPTSLAVTHAGARASRRRRPRSWTVRRPRRVTADGETTEGAVAESGPGTQRRCASAARSSTGCARCARRPCSAPARCARVSAGHMEAARAGPRLAPTSPKLTH
jgi:hypothetical protein